MAKSTKNTRDQLLDIAQDLIQKRGINGFSFQDLSSAVGIRKASVHHHFATKADLIESLMDRFLKKFDDATGNILNSKVNGKSKLKRFCNLFLETLKEGKNDKNCFCGMLMAEVASVENSVRSQIQRFIRENVEVVKAIFEVGVEDGSLAPRKDQKAAAIMVLSTLEGALLVARSDQGPKQFSDITKELVDLLSA